MLIRGIVAILVGILILIAPSATITAVIILLGVFLLINGIFSIVSVTTHKDRDIPKCILIVDGVLSILAGIAILVWPGITEFLIMFVIALWAIFSGIVEIVFAVVTWSRLSANSLVLTAGILSLILGILILVKPAIIAITIVVLIAIYLIIFGIIMVIFSLWLKQAK